MYKTYNISKYKKISIIIIIIIILSIATYNFISYSIETNNKVVYLTFDDGPSEVTNQVIDILEKYNIKATFFVVGKTSKNDIYTYKRLHNQGHTIGIHSFSHNYNKIYSSLENYIKDLKKIEELIFNITGDYTKIIRFPGGSNNTIVDKNIMKKIINYINNNGYIYYDWNVIAKDDKKTATSAQTIVNNIIKSSKNKTNITILFHDDIIRKTLKDALPQIIEYFIKEGYEFKKITDETKPLQHNKG